MIKKSLRAKYEPEDIIISQRQQDKYYSRAGWAGIHKICKAVRCAKRNAALNMQDIFQIKSQHSQQLFLSLKMKCHTVLSKLNAQTSNLIYTPVHTINM